jgi:hypothetical protein
MSTITVHSKTADNKVATLTIELAGPVSAILTGRTYASAAPGPNDKPSKVDVVQLYGITATADGRTVKCRANVPGSDPTVTCRFVDAPGPAVTISIRGTTFGLGDKDLNYPVDQSDLGKLVQFILDAKVPPS